MSSRQYDSVVLGRVGAGAMHRAHDGTDSMHVLLRVAASLLFAIPVLLTLMMLFPIAAKRGAKSTDPTDEGASQRLHFTKPDALYR